MDRTTEAHRPPDTASPAGLMDGLRGLGLRYRLWRNRLVGSPRFRSRIMRFPGSRWIARKKSNDLFKLINGFVFSQVLSTCVTVGLFDRLRDGVMSTPALAAACGLSPDRMKLMLEQAERLALVKSAGPGSWVLDDAGAVVAGDAGLRAMITHHAMFYQDLARPAALFENPKTDTSLKRYWAYTDTQALPSIDTAATQPYSELMRHSQEMLADCILAAHDFGRYGSVLDIGGGEGAFLSAVGAAHPGTSLHLFDLPAVTDLARPHLAAKNLLEKTTLHGGDFATDSLPDAAECACLVRILCDHDDERVRTILANLHRSLKPGTRVIIAEAMAGKSEGAQLAAVYFSLYFLAMGSGRCRTDREIHALLKDAGFKRPRTENTPNPLLATLVIAER